MREAARKQRRSITYDEIMDIGHGIGKPTQARLLYAQDTPTYSLELVSAGDHSLQGAKTRKDLHVLCVASLDSSKNLRVGRRAGRERGSSRDGRRSRNRRRRGGGNHRNRHKHRSGRSDKGASAYRGLATNEPVPGRTLGTSTSILRGSRAGAAAMLQSTPQSIVARDNGLISLRREPVKLTNHLRPSYEGAHRRVTRGGIPQHTLQAHKLISRSVGGLRHLGNKRVSRAYANQAPGRRLQVRGKMVRY